MAFQNPKPDFKTLETGREANDAVKDMFDNAGLPDDDAMKEKVADMFAQQASQRFGRDENLTTSQRRIRERDAERSAKIADMRAEPEPQPAPDSQDDDVQTQIIIPGEKIKQDIELEQEIKEKKRRSPEEMEADLRAVKEELFKLDQRVAAGDLETGEIPATQAPEAEEVVVRTDFECYLSDIGQVTVAAGLYVIHPGIKKVYVAETTLYLSGDHEWIYVDHDRNTDAVSVVNQDLDNDVGPDPIDTQHLYWMLARYDKQASGAYSLARRTHNGGAIQWGSPL
jgi:ribosomal protein L29